MFSIGKGFTAPTVKVDTKERKVEYHPRTYTQFIQGIKNRELPSVIIRPNKNIAVFQEENGDYGDVSIPQNEQLWQTLMESETEVLIDNTQPVLSSRMLSCSFLLLIYLPLVVPYSPLEVKVVWECQTLS